MLRAVRHDDLPKRYRRNVGTVDAAFDRACGRAPSTREMRDIIGFLETLSDGRRR